LNTLHTTKSRVFWRQHIPDVSLRQSHKMWTH